MAASGNRRNKAAQMALSAVREFLRTFAAFGLLGVALAVASAWMLWDDRFRAVASGLLAFVEALIAGAIVGGKRGIGTTVLLGVREFSLGRAVIGQVFSRLLRMPTEGTHGERGNLAAQSLERIPLGKAEAWLDQSIAALAPKEEGRGFQTWLRRRLHLGLTSVIRTITLARFRTEAAAHGGIDLRAVESELESSLDERIAGRLRQGMNLWTTLALIALPLAVVSQTWLLLALHRGHASG